MIEIVRGNVLDRMAGFDGNVNEYDIEYLKPSCPSQTVLSSFHDLYSRATFFVI